MKKALLFSLFALLLTACTGYSNEKSVIENGVEYNISDNHKEAMAESFQWNAREDTAVITIPDTLSDGTPVVTMGGLTGIGVPLHFRIEYEVNWPELPQSRSRKMSEEEVNAFYKEYTEQHPDELVGHLIKVNNPDGSLATESGIDPESLFYKDITFTINIGKNVSSTGPHISDYSILEKIYKYGIIQSDGSILVYRPALYFNVDPGNETYYAEDGVLYTKTDGKPVLYVAAD